MTFKILFGALVLANLLVFALVRGAMPVLRLPLAPSRRDLNELTV